MDAFVAWLQTTSLSQAIVLNTWVWPASETIHFIGLALVIGIVGFFDLRLVGFFKRVAVAAARDLMPFAVLGFVLNLITGLIFLIGQPQQYVHNISWWFKFGCLIVAGLNALFFETLVGSRVMGVGSGEDTPSAAKLVGLLSLVAWIGVLYFGRILPFIGDAF